LGRQEFEWTDIKHDLKALQEITLTEKGKIIRGQKRMPGVRGESVSGCRRGYPSNDSRNMSCWISKKQKEKL